MAVRLTASNIKDTSAELTVKGMSSAYNYKRNIEFRTGTTSSIDKSYYEGEISVEPNATTASYPVDGLKPNTYYYMFAVIRDTAGNVLARVGTEESYTFRTKPRPVKSWEWYKNNGSNTRGTETIDSYSALFNGYTINFSHNVWNDMIEKTEEIYDAIGWSIPTLDGCYRKFSSIEIESNGTFTAKKFNSLRAILEYCRYGEPISTFVETNDRVYGSYLEDIANLINRCISYHDLNWNS